VTSVLVTGGAGYVGSTLVPMLFDEGYQVRVFDNLMHGGQGLLSCFSRRNFEFVRGDVRDEAAVAKALKNADVVIHLAAIVGYPTCKKDPNLAEDVNLHGTISVKKCRAPAQLIIFASTGSNYGAVPNQVCTEDTPLNPLTLYGLTKTEAESHLLEAGNVIVYRFTTAFGLSPRMRLDLLVNDFVFSALKRKQLIIYEKTYRRSFVHVRDIARALVFAIQNAERMVDNVYNVGSESMNASKEEVALRIRDKLDFLLHFADFGHDEDERNYEVSYAKIRSLGFETTISLDEGIHELIQGLEVLDVPRAYSNV